MVVAAGTEDLRVIVMRLPDMTAVVYKELCVRSVETNNSLRSSGWQNLRRAEQQRVVGRMSKAGSEVSKQWFRASGPAAALTGRLTHNLTHCRDSRSLRGVDHSAQ